MAGSAGLRDELSRNGWFGALPQAIRIQMVERAELVRLLPGEMLFRQGDAPSGLYGMVSGTLKMSSLREDGREAILAVLEQGIWFGEIALIDDQPRTHDATAIGPVELLVLPRVAFDALMESAVFARAVAQLMAGRIRLLYGIVEDATLRSTRARIARRLLLMARGDSTLSPLRRPRVPVAQEHLAMMLGISRQTLSKQLRLLAGQGVLVLGYGYIEVVREEALARLARA